MVGFCQRLLQIGVVVDEPFFDFVAVLGIVYFVYFGLVVIHGWLNVENLGIVYVEFMASIVVCTCLVLNY